MSERETPALAVPESVLAAYGLGGLSSAAEPLEGGQGTSVRVGDAVLKPDVDEDEAAWLGQTLSRVVPDGFRLAAPLPAGDGGWWVDGWTAARWVAGTVGPSERWPETLAAGRALHAALAAVPRPSFLDTRVGPWATADRVAFGELVVDVVPELAPVVSELLRLRRPVVGPSQLVHGDLAGNLLFAEGLPPAVIDLSPYWRPAAYADAVVAVDGLLWWGAGSDLLELAARGAGSSCVSGAGPQTEFGQLLVRALIFRVVAYSELVRDGATEDLDEVRRFTSAAAQIRALVCSGE